MHSLARLAARRGLQVRHIATTVTRAAASTELTQAQKDDWYPKVGNRDVVGYGFNGNPVYVDREEFPCPAIRFKENTPEILALREKEKGDWSQLTIEEKKTLYRASFCQTYAEMKAPTGEWKGIMGIILLGASVTLWFMIYMKTFVYPEIPSTVADPKWQEIEIQQMIRQRQNPVEGIASKYDYEKNEWK